MNTSVLSQYPFSLDYRQKLEQDLGMTPSYITVSELRDLGIQEIWRRLRAIEGYVDLGMFEAAEEELQALDPAWFALDQILSLQLRVFVGLNQSE